jgi:hypothetical protein
MIPLSQKISAMRYARAIFEKWSLFWAEQGENQRSHQQVELSGKDGPSCTEESPFFALALAA